MRTVLVVLLAALGSTAVACERGNANPTSSSAPARDPHKVVAEGGSLVDVRTPEEFAGKHLTGAKNIPVDEVESRVSEIPKDKPVVVYCATGGRSAAAAKMLKAAGYDVIDVGAMKNW